jgi:phosphoglycerol transferase
MMRSREALVWLAPPVVIAAILWIALASPERTFSVPVNQSPSALVHLAQVKGVVDDGTETRLLPWIAPVDWLIVRTVGLTVGEVGGTANLSWLLMLMMGGPFAAWGYRRLGISIAGSCVMGILYALSPYALYWNLEAPSVMPFLVPFAATAALALATGAVQQWPRRDVLVLLAGNVLLGLNGREYAYFGAFLTVIGAIAGAVRFNRAAAIRSTIVTAVIVAATVASLLPGIRAPQPEPDPNFRVTAADAEAGGVKIRQLVGPLPWHWLPLFSEWSRREGVAGFPYETVNHLSRLGIVASVGFLGLLVALLIPAAAGPPPNGETVRAASGLTLAAFLVATVGGLGSIISLLIEPETLVFSRVTPFFIFFSLAAIGFWVDRAATSPRRGQMLWAAVAILGLLDQMVAVRPLHRGVAKARIEYRQLQAFVDVLERKLPPGSRVFQLPNRTDVFYRRGVRMGPNDHLKPYLVSHSLQWRYPARTDADVRDDAPRHVLETGALPERLAQDGFSALVVDRLGYDDNGDAVLAVLLATSRTVVLAESDRYVAFLVRK